MLSDVEIAQQAKLLPILEIGKRLGLQEDELELYGFDKAKIKESAFRRLRDKQDGHLILVTAINPTPAGEGKTTVSVGLGQAMNQIGKNAVIALREPSLGPVFGMKGGAAGGGYAQVVPMEAINLHFTGDMHAVTAANNLLCAMVDNHIYQGNALQIDPRTIVFSRVMDMNDRALRGMVVGLGGKTDGIPREESFKITVASEIMAILCLADDLMDLKERLGRILVGYTYGKKPVYCGALKASGAMAALLKDAMKPNLVQTLEHTPCLIHGGPFANIAHGCNSVRATKLALKLGDYAITEAGFGADLGAEKFFDIKCRKAGLSPEAVVLVATVKALKYNGGVAKGDLSKEDLGAMERGICNLQAHLDNIGKFGVPVVVALNRFPTDTAAEMDFVADYCSKIGVPCVFTTVFAQGGAGGLELARAVVELIDQKQSRFHTLYPDELPLEDKIRTIAREIYGAVDVKFEGKAARRLRELTDLGCGALPVCMAKTQYSLSDDPALLGRPAGFTLHVRDVLLSGGAGFVVALNGNIMTMPGLPKVPAAEQIDVDAEGNISGLF